MPANKCLINDGGGGEILFLGEFETEIRPGVESRLDVMSCEHCGPAAFPLASGPATCQSSPSATKIIQVPASGRMVSLDQCFSSFIESENYLQRMSKHRCGAPPSVILTQQVLGGAYNMHVSQAHTGCQCCLMMLVQGQRCAALYRFSFFRLKSSLEPLVSILTNNVYGHHHLSPSCLA